jgi:DNA-binding MarR family transcriptional regulator
MALLPVTRRQLAALLDITNSAACQRVQDLAARGLVTGARGPVALAPVALAPVGVEALLAAPSQPVAAPLPDDALPARVVVSGSALRVLRYLVELNRPDVAGRRPTQKSIAADLRAPRSSITTLIRSLMAAGLVEADASLSTRHRRNVPTALGIAVVDGRVPVVSRQLVQAEKRIGRRAEAPPVAARASRPRRSAEDIRAAVARVQVHPVPAAPTVARELAPVDVGPPVPPGLDVNAPARTVRHPPPPGPGVRDASRYSAPYWERITNAPHSGLHTACQRGTA